MLNFSKIAVVQRESINTEYIVYDTVVDYIFRAINNSESEVMKKEQVKKQHWKAQNKP